MSLCFCLPFPLAFPYLPNFTSHSSLLSEIPFPLLYFPFSFLSAFSNVPLTTLYPSGQSTFTGFASCGMILSELSVPLLPLIPGTFRSVTLHCMFCYFPFNVFFIADLN
jgi:hypothetical protein